jgi:ABC-2 type transport system permease protein
MDPYDLLEYTTSSTDSTTSYVTGLRAEQRLTSAILYVTANKVPKAAYITGHQETTDLEEMDSLLTSGNYEVTSLSLMQENEIPSDVDMVIISQPMGDYTDEEIEILDQFLNNGGHMIVTYASNTPSLPNLEAYFEEWGVQYESQMVYDTERCYAGWNAYILPNITTVENLTDNLDSKSYAIIPGARPISVLWDQDNWRGTQVLMTTSNNSYAKDLSTESTAYEKTDDDETGPFNVGVLAYQTEMHNLNSTYSYILFLNAGFVSDSALSSQSFLNKDYFLAALNFMSDDSESVVIASKDLTTDNLVVPGSAKTVLYYLLIFIIPGLCLVGGILVWARRRHK